MNRHHITLSEPVSRALRAQVKSGRYKDFSAAIQDAAWNYFVRQPSVFEEYGVKSEGWTGRPRAIWQPSGVIARPED
jgi:hypothetical protein